MAADKINIEIDVETRKAISELAKLEGATKKAETSGVNLGAAFQSMRNGASAFASTMTTAIGATAGLITGLTAFAAHAEQHERAVRRLGTAYDAVQAATRGTVTAAQAMQLQQSIVQSGTQVTAQQMGVLTRAAREYADATGTDVSQALDKMTNAIVNNSEDALQEFGIATARASTSARTLANATRELEQRQRDTAPAVRTLTEDLQKLPTAMTEVGASILRAVEGPFNAAMQRFLGIANATGQAREALRLLAEFGDDQRANARGAADLATRERRRVARQGMIDVFSRRGLVTGGVRVQDITEEEANTLSTLARTGAGQSEIENALSSLRRQRATVAARPAAASPTARARPAARSGGGGGGGQNELRDAIRSYQEMIAEAPVDAVTVTPADLPQNPRESATAYYQRLAEIQRGFNQAGAVNDLTPTDNSAAILRDALKADDERAAVGESSARQQRRFARDRETRRMALEQGGGVGGAVARGLGVTGDSLETQARMTQGYADTIIGAYGKIGDAITRHVELVASGQETIGQALLNGVHEVTKALAMEALPKALMETAAGFAALANPLTAATAPLHFTAAGVYGAVAAGAGLVAGVTGALGAGQSPQAGAGARATGAARSASGMSQGAPSSSAAPVTIVLSSIVPPGPGELQRLVDAGSQAGRYNLDRRRDMVPRQVRA